MHRPRYDDWSLPKGKLDAGETWEAAALREVEEEVGMRCRLGEELPPVRYRDNKGRDKAVRYWLMEPEDDAAPFTPNDEVDEMRWTDVAARRRAAELSARRRARPRRARARMNRERFPGAAGGWARLDGPAGTQMVDSAIDAMDAWMRSGRGANHGGAFAAAHATDECVEQARAAVGRLLGAEPQSVAFGPSMTAMTMRLSAAVGRTLVARRRGRRHAARPRRQRAPVGDRGRARRSDGALGRARSRHARAARRRDRGRALRAHALGRGDRGVERDRHRARARRDRRRCARRRARISIDAVAAAPHRPLDLRALGADTLVCSSYKWYGPHVGILCGAPGLLAELVPDKLEPVARRAARPVRAGTLPFESLAGVTAAAEYMLEVGFDAIRAHEEELLAIAATGLAEIEGVTLYGDPPDRVPTLMFNVAGHTSAEVATALAEREIAVWDGNYYASELERFLGLDPHGAVRAGFVQYNDADDARRLVAAVRDVAEGARDGRAASASQEAPA